MLVLAGCSFREKTIEGDTTPLVDWGTAIIPKITFVDPAPGVSIQTPHKMKISITDDGAITNSYIVFVGQTNTLTYNTTNGYYEFQIQSMPDGYHSAIAAAYDDDGNKAQNAMTVIVANPAGTPSIMYASPQPNEWLGTGAFSGTYYVNNGTLAASNAVSVFTNNGFAGYAAYGSGNWSYTLDLAPYADSTTVGLKVIAVAKGDKAATNSTTFRVDKTLPDALITAPTNNQSVPASGFTISGNSTDAPSGVDTVTVGVAGVWQTNLSSGAFSFAFPGVLYGGTNKVILTVTDFAGNVQAKTNRIISAYLPNVLLTNYPADTVFTAPSAVFAGTASISGGNLLTGLTLKLSNSATVVSNRALSGVSANWSQAVSLSALSEGAFYAYAIASANNGTNNAAVAVPVRYYKDTAAPTNWIDTANITTNAKNILIGVAGYSFDGGSGLDKVLVVVSNYAGTTTNMVLAFGVKTLSWDKDVFVRLGTNTVTVSAIDRSGKESSKMSKKVVCNRAISIDGANDFDNVNEKFATTTSGYSAYVTWNGSYIYLAFEGSDIGANDPKKWLLVYISTNTNDALGNKTGVQYNNQKPYLPFKAQYHLGLQLVNSGGVINESYGSGWGMSGWFTEAGNLYRTGNYFEIRIPKSDIGNYTRYYLTMFLVCEQSGVENTYAKLYSDNLPDFYNTHLSKYIDINLTDITTAPNSPSFKKTFEYVPPTVSITNPAASSSTTNTNIAVAGTASDTGSAVQSVYLKLDGGIFRKVSGTSAWSTNLKGVTVGAHTLYAYSVDSYNNVSQTNSVGFNVTASFNTYHTLAIDGTLDFYKATEFLGEGGAGIGAAVTWDATYLYIVISNKNFNDSAAKLNIYITTNTNVGATHCIDYDGGSNWRLHPRGIKVMYCIEVMNPGTGSAKLFKYSGSDWNFTDLGVDFAYIGWSGNSTTEVKVAWSKLDLSAGKKFYLHGFVTDGASDYVYSTWPTNNIKGEDNSVSPASDHYYEYTIGSGVSPNSAVYVKP